MAIDELLDRYALLLQRVDAWFRRCVANSGAAIRCRAGCSECCRGLFDITLLDALYLKRGFDRLSQPVQEYILFRSVRKIRELQSIWPDFTFPFLLNTRPEAEWEILMPEDDITPCLLLDQEGCCLLYDYRPMTCRLYGLPLVDLTGEFFHDELCPHNCAVENPHAYTHFKEDFVGIFQEEGYLLRILTESLFSGLSPELATVIPAAFFLDNPRFVPSLCSFLTRFTR